MQLAGFRKILLNPGESRKVKFHLHTAQLGYYNENMEFVVEPGDLTLMVGTASDQIVFRKKIRLTGKAVNVMGQRVYTCPSEII